jgi:hypothetical protein
MAALPPREGGDVVATADRVVHDGTPEETRAPENKKSHVWVSCRAASYGDDTFRQELSSATVRVAHDLRQSGTAAAARW